MRAALSLCLLASCSPHTILPTVQANDNRTPAGTIAGDTLTVRLAVQMANWKPEADSSRGVDVATFTEDGHAPQIPAPLLRVKTGTVIHAVVRNALRDSTITLYGLHTRPATKDDSLVIHPGDTSSVTFAAGEPGTYLYGAVLGKHRFDGDTADDEREQLGGAFVVDPVNGSPPDRVLVMNIWGKTVDSSTYRNALAINGRAWPYDEQMQANVGDTIRWRVVNATNRGHPMHLHGFYFTVLAKGDSRQDTVYHAANRQLAVTHQMRGFSTYDMEWVPNRPGNWLYHCHIGFHVVPEAARFEPGPSDAHEGMSADPRQHMAGLVLGITVNAPSAWKPASRANPRLLRLYIQEATKRGRAPRALGFVLQGDGHAPAKDSVEVSSTPLILTRGQPTDIMVINHLKEASAVHWHGIELESWSDGVAGWSGAALKTAPSIQPGDSFVAHLSLPRAGTFIYHTHMNDLEQLSSGLYGAIIVLEPGQHFNPANDHVFLAGWDGPKDPPHVLVNGDSLSHEMAVSSRESQRLRFINIGVASGLTFMIARDTVPDIWQAAAKDGADLPKALAVSQPATVRVRPGETFDFIWKPTPGTYRLTVAPAEKPALVRTIVVQ